MTDTLVALRRVRAELESKIEGGGSPFDLLEGDPDFEPTLSGWDSRLSEDDDREGGDPDLEDGRDDEPCLGWTQHVDQTSPQRFGDTSGLGLELSGGYEPEAPKEDGGDNANWRARGIPALDRCSKSRRFEPIPYPKQANTPVVSTAEV